MSATYSLIDVKPVSGALGAEIYGVDMQQPISDGQFSEIKEAFGEYSVIFFRDQILTPEQEIAFAERWGKINVNRFFSAVDGYPQIALVVKDADQRNNIGGSWHTDHSYDSEPALGSVLFAHHVPKSGGDTLFASMSRAYDTLSEGLKDTLNSLRARHSSRHVFGPARAAKGDDDTVGRIKNSEAAMQDAIHPVVITHPETGRKGLYVNPGFTLGFEGWSDAESKPLLDYLYSHASRPEFTCRFEWRQGSIAFWDNRATWHLAVNDYHGERRMMHRITIEGKSLN
ncbi:MAG: taurine dioxygenase [Rhodospirillaceae bacterium]|nr:taurine dioxygenase [Rhodospirillaceae bacterium]|tara:strand:+ start:544 stop:1398 length:855 start_codon:yes stop_codon:yes gene_type:complete